MINQITQLNQQLTHAYRAKYPPGTKVTFSYYRNGPYHTGVVERHSRRANTMLIKKDSDGYPAWVNARHFK